jgi:hypothetical protein
VEGEESMIKTILGGFLGGMTAIFFLALVVFLGDIKSKYKRSRSLKLAFEKQMTDWRW